MPITVDLEENPLFVEIFERYTQRGEQRGIQIGEQRAKITMLRRLLEKRFGELPNWVNVRLEQATAPELERWSLTFLDVTRLEDVFREDE